MSDLNISNEELLAEMDNVERRVAKWPDWKKEAADVLVLNINEGAMTTEPKTQTERLNERTKMLAFIDKALADHAASRHPNSALLCESIWKAATEYHQAATRGLREQLEAAEAVIRHYADESFWDDPHPEIGPAATLYAYDDEYLCEYSGYTIAQEYLKKHGGE
jgi:hypothetical protein